MTRFATLTGAATCWLALLAGLLALPTAARAQDCTSDYIQCWVENGGSTQCIHEYIECVTTAILQY
jgi:hypothetical protein